VAVKPRHHRERCERTLGFFRLQDQRDASHRFRTPIGRPAATSDTRPNAR
jgi:hypothetical protein